MYTVMNHGQVYFLLSDTAEPALHFIVPVPLCAEPQGKNGLAHVSELVMLSLIEARLTEVMTGSFGFYAHTGFSGIQFHFRHLKTEENIRIVYRAIQESLYPTAIPNTVLKNAKAHVLKECRELKQFYAQVLKQTRFLTGCKSITMPVGKVKEVQSITEQDVLQFIRDRYGEHTFIIVGNRLDSSISEDTRTAELVRQTRCVFEKTRRKRHKPFLHTALPSCAVQTVSLCIHVDNDRAAGNYFVLTALHLYIIECMNTFFQRKGMHDDACGDARTTMQKVDSETMISFLTFMQSVDILKNAINNTLSMGSQGYEDSLYMENLFNLLELTGDRGEAPFNRHFHTIECRNVWFTYPFSDIPVIKDFSFCFSADKTYGFVGLNGSGKTTLIKLLLGFYTSYQGSILIDGIELRDIDIKHYHTHISAVFQDFVRYPFTVTENIGLGDEALFLTQDGVKTITENEAVYQAAHFSKADEFIRKLPNQYASILGKEWQNGTQISIGQWQKIAVARAAVKKSRIFIFDEPTASIDPISEYEFFKNVRSLAQNSLCILVTHRFANIKAADEILVLSDGALIQSGTHQELFDSEGLYRELYTMQAESYLEDKT